VAVVEGGKPAIDSTASDRPDPAKAQATGQASLNQMVSRGYKEEMEHFAYCVRLWNQADKKDRMLPRCHGRVAMADAIIALTANQAMRKRQRIEFKADWFEPSSKAVPDADVKPEAVA